MIVAGRVSASILATADEVGGDIADGRFGFAGNDSAQDGGPAVEADHLTDQRRALLAKNRLSPVPEVFDRIDGDGWWRVSARRSFSFF